jgi:hypothetical protein
MRLHRKTAIGWVHIELPKQARRSRHLVAEESPSFKEQDASEMEGGAIRRKVQQKEVCQWFLWNQAMVKRWCKRPPAAREIVSAR